MTVTKPEESASDKSSNIPDAQGKSAEPGKAVRTTPVAAGKPADGTGAAPAPAIESGLVGKAGAEALPPAARKSPAPADEADEAVSSVPASGTASANASATGRPAENRLSETRVVEVRKAGFMPMLLGGIVAAGLGAGAAYWAIPQLPPAWQPGGAPAEQPDPAGQIEAARAAGADAARAALQAGRDDLTAAASEAGTNAGAEAARQIMAEAAPAEAGAAAVPVDLTPLETALADQARRIDGLDAAITALNTPASDPAPSPSTAGLSEAASPAALRAVQSALAQLRTQVEQQESRISELAARPATDPETARLLSDLTQQAEEARESIAATAAQAEARITAAETEAARLQEETQTMGQRARVLAALAGLQAALESGGGLAGGIAELQEAGVTLPAALSADVPALPVLQRNYDAAARAALDASRRAGAESGDALDAIGNFLRVQTGARSVELREGADPDAVLSRAGNAVHRGDIGAALDELAALPQAGQQAMASWISDAQLWLQARSAVAELSETVK